MRTRQFVIEGLGHLSTLLADEAAGVAVVVDPRRDVDAYLDAAAEDGLRISHVLETHLHNDYVSGARELAALTGARHVIGAGAALAFEHHGARDGQTIDVGSLRLTALDTPGHTPEHVAWAVADRSRADEPVLLFTGGSLLVGAVGRTDLLGTEHALPYARDQFRSVRETILGHDDHVAIMPTHGAGSLCSTGISSSPWSTIGYERRHNRMATVAELDAFARVLLDGQPSFPAYFARMRPLNQSGPRLLGGRVADPRPIDMEQVQADVARGALVVDLRSPAAYATQHPTGSWSIPAGTSFGTWLGWVVEPDRPLILLLERPEDWDDAIRQALRVGYEDVVGYVAGGFAAWIGAGAPVESGGRLTVDQLAAGIGLGGPDSPLVLDVRQPSEFSAGHVPGALHIGAGELSDRLADLPRDRPIATVCASGYRSSVAASLLRRAGFSDVAWVAEGVPAWRARGYPIETGGEADEIDGVSTGQPEPAHRH